ncbi:MAG: Maf family protein [Gammaproteobacteria bacterium]|jgi:septum formation protein
MNSEIVVLASGSPRRRQLLEQIGVPHQIHAVEVDESRLACEAPMDLARRLALAKAGEAWAELSGANGNLVMGADTAVALDGMLFGKPRDSADAIEMLTRLSGRTHQVFTAVAGVQEGERMIRESMSSVTFRRLSSAEISEYVGTGEPLDKAGAYAIQGLAAIFVERLEGSYSGVMGLPLFETWDLLRTFGYDVLAGATPRRGQ